MDLRREWYVTTNGTPYSTFFPMKHSLTRKYNFASFTFYKFMHVSRALSVKIQLGVSKINPLRLSLVSS